MACEKYEKWISDEIDGVLKEKRKTLLEEHFEQCAACRSYREYLRIIQAEKNNLTSPPPSPEYWLDFGQRLKRKIQTWSPEGKPEKVQPWGRRWNWTWAVASLFVVVLLGLSLLIFRRAEAREIYLFSLEESVNRLYQDIGNNTELENTFNSILQGSIEEHVQRSNQENGWHFDEGSLLWENLSEEELKFLENELKNEIKL